MSENKLQVINDVSGTQLAPYANRDVVRELMERVMGFHPVISKMRKTNPAAAQETGLRVAQFAILLGASPLPGLNEIHVYDDGRAEVGINYWERRGEQKGGVLWDFEARPMTRQEVELYDVKDGFYGAICRGLPLVKVRELQSLGLGINDIVKGQSLTGIAVVPKGERAKNGRPPIWTAIKRCKTDFYKTAFPYIPGETAIKPGAGLRQTGEGFEPDFTSHGWDEMGGRESTEPSPATTNLSSEEINNMLFDTPIPEDDDFNQDTEAIEGEVIEDEVIEDERGEMSPGEQDKRDPRNGVPDSAFRIGDEVVVAGKDDEKPGTVTGFADDLVSVFVDGKNYNVKPERVTLVDMA